VSEGQTLVFNATLLVDPERPVPVTIKASKTDSGDRIFLLNRQDTYTNGCGEKCLHAAILEAQYQHNPGGILLVNREREKISFNNEFVKMWGIPPEILESRDEGASLRYALEKTNDPRGFLAKVHALYETPDAESTDEIHLKDSRVFYRQTYPAFRDSEYLGRVWYFLDITPLKNAQYQLENQQIYLNAILQHVQDGIIACDAEGRLSLFNRASRELFGKSKTEPMPETLRTCLRDSDIICRWGGDEFVIGLHASSATDEVIAVAEKICAKVLENISKKDRTFQVSVSVGIAMYPAHGTEPDLLIRNADMAMYRAKRLGKNRCELFLPKDSG
jgi:PAS domain-containing protein